MRVSATGGEPQALTTLDTKKNEEGHTWPQFLPGGAAVLFSIRNGPSFEDGGHIAVLSLATGEHRVVVEQGFHGRYVPTGHIVYLVGGTLMAVPFDLESAQTTGSPVPVEEGIRGSVDMSGEAHFAVSRTGFLVYSPGPMSGSLTRASRTLVWVSRDGKEEAIPAPPRPYAYARLCRRTAHAWLSMSVTATPTSGSGTSSGRPSRASRRTQALMSVPYGPSMDRN
jgi:serine/threonine-protein kinase